MKKVWISYCTEHEFGQRDDGYMVSDDLDAMKAKIEANQGTGSRAQYWTYSEPMEVWCSKKTFKKIMERKAQNALYDIAFFENREKLKLFKQI